MQQKIKPANILRHRAENEEKYTYKIADFGLAVKYNNSSDLSTICGTKRFMAPEMNGNKYGPEVDVWSLGVLYYSMLVGKHAQVDATKEESIGSSSTTKDGEEKKNDDEKEDSGEEKTTSDGSNNKTVVYTVLYLCV